MEQTDPSIVLASASPRRSELLELAGIRFRVAPADIPEEQLPGEGAVEHAMRLADAKARVAASRDGSAQFFIGADTIVVLDGEIMGKPKDNDDAFRMLSALSGRWHEVVTAYSVFDREQNVSRSRAVSTGVLFRDLLQEEIWSYINTGCPLDKAGSYAIQGGAAHMVREIKGSYTNVVGLPTCELYETLQQLGAI